MLAQYEEKLINALKQLPNPIVDNKHRIKIRFENDRARSNQSRFTHIVVKRHKLKVSDIKRIAEKVNKSILKKDKERKDTYNLYIKRNNISEDYIKISMEIKFKESNDAFVRTIYITENDK